MVIRLFFFPLFSGDDDEEESGEERLPSCFDYIMHFLTVFWKVLFAFVPPTEYWNGWACFFVSISLIGILTAVTGDLASHFGCTIGLKDSVTAVVFVALGTSVPGGCVFAVCPFLHYSLSHCAASLGFVSVKAAAWHGRGGAVLLVIPSVLSNCISISLCPKYCHGEEGKIRQQNWHSVGLESDSCIFLRVCNNKDVGATTAQRWQAYCICITEFLSQEDRSTRPKSAIYIYKECCHRFVSLWDGCYM